MTDIKTWILGITVTALLLAVLDELCPEGAVRRVERCACALVLMLTVLSPLSGLRQLDFSDRLSEYQSRSDADVQTMTGDTQEYLSGIIASESEAYFAQKASGLGLTCTAEIGCGTDSDSGCPVPVSAVVTGCPEGAARAEAEKILEEDLGINGDSISYQSGG